MHIRVINPTITTHWEEESRLAYAQAAHPDTKVSVVTLDWGTASIESYRDHALVIPDILNKALQAQREGVDAVIIDCMGDPGLYPLREALNIPVVGPAEASMHMAAMLAHRFSVLTVLDSRKPMMEEQVAGYGLTSKLASIRAFNIPVLDLEKDPQATLTRVVDVGEMAVREDDAHILIPACTGLAGWAPRIQAQLAQRGCEVPVLDPPSVAVKLAEMFVSLGYAHSKRTFPAPEAKEYYWPGLSLFENGYE